jgi:thiosulfate dehydrogenase [quinone] large subunit
MAIHTMTQTHAPAKQRVAALETVSWRAKWIALLRIGFGLIWAIDAWFKWQPGFRENVLGYLKEGMDGQAPLVYNWVHFWYTVVNINPTAFAYFVAIVETAIAFGLIFGVFSNLAYLGGALFALAIWVTAEGFGGPYGAGSTDVGAGILYVPTFVALFLMSAGKYWGIDHWLTPRLGRLKILASGWRD